MPWDTLLNTPEWLYLSGLIGQTVIVAWAARTLWSPLKQWVSCLLTGRQLTILLLFMAFAGVVVTQDVFHTGKEWLFAGWVVSINALNLVLVAVAIPAGVLKKVAGRLEQLGLLGTEGKAGRSRWGVLLPWLVAGWVTLIAASIAWFVLERVPHVPDSISYLFQAKYFSTGQLYLPAPPDAAAFDFSHAYIDGTKWWAYGFPGWPAILALGVLFGVPWLVNPLLGGVSVLLSHALLRRLYDRVLANAVVLLMAVSPWFLFMSASFMAHTVTVVWTLIALLSVAKARESRYANWGTLAGISLGCLFLTRPLEGILIGSVIGLWSLGVGGTRLSGKAIAGLVAASIIIGSLIFPYNATLTGHALRTPHEVVTDARWYPGIDRLGFGHDVGNYGWPHLDPLPGHGLADIVINANRNFYMSNFELFGWGFGSLLFAVLALLVGKCHKADRLFLAIVGAIVLGHSFFWFSGGPDFGARYWYQTLVPLIVLTVRGVQSVQQRVVMHGATRRISYRVVGLVVTASLVAFCNVMPWRCLTKYHHYRGFSAEIDRLAQAHGFGHSLVFVRTEEGRDEDYYSAFAFNPPMLDAPGTIYALDAGADHRVAVQRHFSDRPVWFVGRSPTDGNRLEVLAGPLPPED